MINTSPFWGSPHTCCGWITRPSFNVIEWPFTSLFRRLSRGTPNSFAFWLSNFPGIGGDSQIYVTA